MLSRCRAFGKPTENLLAADSLLWLMNEFLSALHDDLESDPDLRGRAGALSDGVAQNGEGLCCSTPLVSRSAHFEGYNAESAKLPPRLDAEANVWSQRND